MISGRDSQLDEFETGGYLSIAGWGVDQFLIQMFRRFDRFHRKLGVSGPLFEIGVHEGRTLVLFALLAREGEKCVGVDLFDSRQAENIDHSGSGSAERVRANLKIFAPETECQLVESNSFDFRYHPAFANVRGARLCHIDGGHFLEVVLNDIDIMQTVVGPGGVIVIDDYLHSGFPEVQEAVHRYFWTSTNIKAIPFAIGRNKIYLISAAFHTEMIRFLSDDLPPEIKKRVKLLGYDAICVDPH